MRKTGGFTILELLVVIAIIAVLAVIAVPNFMGQIDKSKDSRELAEINSVTKAAQMFYTEKGYYPTLQGSQPVFGDPKNLKFTSDEDGEGLCPKYLSTLPHFSYWYIDYKGKVYHTEKSLEDLINMNQYDEYTTNLGETYKIPYELRTTAGKKEGPVVNERIFGRTMPHPESRDSKKPTAVINMTPASGITTNTIIKWSYEGSSAADGATIVSAEWEGAQEKYPEPGTYTIRLRVKDSNGLWSEWTSKTIVVGEAARVVAPAGYERMTDNDFNTEHQIPYNSDGSVHYLDLVGSTTGKILAFRIRGTGNDLTFGYVGFVDNEGRELLTDCLYPSISRGTKFGTSRTSTSVIYEYRVAIPEGAAKVKIHGCVLPVQEVYIVETGMEQISNVKAETTQKSVTVTYDIPNNPNFKQIVVLDAEDGHIATTTTNSFTISPLYSDKTYKYNIYVMGKNNEVSAAYMLSFTTKPSSDGVTWRGLTPAAFDKDVNTRSQIKGTAYVTWSEDIVGRTIRVNLSAKTNGQYDGIAVAFVDSNDKEIQTYCKSRDMTNTWFEAYNGADAMYELVVPEGAVKMKVVGYGSTFGFGYVQEIMAID